MKLKEEFRNLDIPEGAMYLKNGFYIKRGGFASVRGGITISSVWIKEAWVRASDLGLNSPAHKVAMSAGPDDYLYEEGMSHIKVRNELV